MARGGLTAADARIEAPTLVIWGERDAALSVRNLDGLHEIAPALTIRRLPDAGHWVHHEAPEHVAAALIPFLAGD